MTEDSGLNLGGAVDLTKPPFRLTITMEDDGSHAMHVEPNGVAYAVAIVGLLSAAAKAMHDCECDVMRKYAEIVVSVRDLAVGHLGEEEHAVPLMHVMEVREEGGDPQ